MGVIIRMGSKKLVKDFLKEIPNHEDFQFILISERVTTSEKFPNVKAIPQLLPPPRVAKVMINDNFKSYKKEYLNYLTSERIEAFISIMVKAVMINDLNLVLVCSESESEFKYLNLICEYIEGVYGLETYTYKSYMKNPKKAHKIKNKDDIMKVLTRKFNQMENSKVDLDDVPNKKTYIKELKKFGRKELRAFAKSKNIKLGKDMEKKEMIMTIAKKMMA